MWGFGVDACGDGGLYFAKRWLLQFPCSDAVRFIEESPFYVERPNYFTSLQRPSHCCSVLSVPNRYGSTKWGEF